MSFKIKQRFGEVLAIALIVIMVGFLVFMLLPSHSKTPKSAPVTVRSSTTVEEQSHASKLSVQSPPTSQVLQGSTVTSKTTARTTTLTPVSSEAAPAIKNKPTPSGFPGNKIQNQNQQQGNNSTGVVASAEPKATTTCTTLERPVARVGSLLQMIPIVGDLVSATTKCS